MNIVEYIDNEGKPNGQYAKRFEEEILIDKEVDSDILMADGTPAKKIIKKKAVGVRDEVIPKRIFCICDSAGNIKSITEIKFSYAIEVEGKQHCFGLKDGEECYQILDIDMPVIPDTEPDKLKWLLDNHSFDKAGKKFKRKI